MAYIKRIGDKKYFIRVSSGTGSGRTQKSRTFRGTRKQADTWAREFEGKLDAGFTVEEITLTLDEYLDKWLGIVQKRLRTRTLDSYKENLARYIQPTLGKIKLSELKTKQIQNVGNTMSERGLSPRTVRYTLGILKSALIFGVKQEYLRKNPLDNIVLPKNEKREMIVLDEFEAMNFVATCQSEANGIILELAIETGLRVGEYLGLRWQDVDLTNQTLTVQQAVTFKAGGGFEFNPPKTKSSRRSIPFSDALRKRLIDHKREQNEWRLQSGVDYNRHNLVFVNQAGSPIRIENLRNRCLRPILIKARIAKKINLKTLRHTCATLLLKVGEQPKVVQERLGHKDISTTLNFYAHVLPGQQARATERINNVLRISEN